MALVIPGKSSITWDLILLEISQHHILLTDFIKSSIYKLNCLANELPCSRVCPKDHKYTEVAVRLIKAFEALHCVLYNFTDEQKGFLRDTLCFSIMEITVELKNHVSICATDCRSFFFYFYFFVLFLFTQLK